MDDTTSGKMEECINPEWKGCQSRMHQESKKRIFISSQFQKPWTIEVVGGLFNLTKINDTYSRSGLELGPGAPKMNKKHSLGAIVQ